MNDYSKKTQGNNNLVKDNRNVGKDSKRLSKDNKYVSKNVNKDNKNVGKDNKYVSKDDKYVSKDNKNVGKDNKYVSKDNKYVSKDNKNVDKDNKYVGKDNKFVSKDNKNVGNDNKNAGKDKKYVSKDNKYADKSYYKESREHNSENKVNKINQGSAPKDSYKNIGKPPIKKTYHDYENLDDFEDFTNLKDMNEYLKSEKKKGLTVQGAGKKKAPGLFNRENTRTKSYDKTDKLDVKKDRPAVNKGGCKYIRECGSCNILKQPYEVGLKEKQKFVESLLKTYCRVETIIGMKNPNYYRNKVHVVFDHDKKGNPVSGVYEEGSHRVVPIESCLIHNQKADAIIASIRGMLKSFKIKTYDEDSGYGLLRHVLIRTGFASGQIMVVLVLASPIFPSKNNFVKALLKLHPDITTIVVNVNDKQTSMVLGEKEQIIYGKGYIEDSLSGKVFRLSPKSFYQVNPGQTEVIYGKAIEMAGLTGKETIVDAYCGIGTIGIIAADHVKKVIGVELNKDAVKDAVINAKRNEANNIDFYNNDAGEFMTQMAEQQESVDVVFMDPPRTGSSEKFMDAVVLLKPKKVVYISCNPVTLERDLNYITKKGYKAQKAIPVDMFPWTGHVETVCLMSRKESK